MLLKNQEIKIIFYSELSSYTTSGNLSFSQGGTLYQSRLRQESFHMSGEDPKKASAKPVHKIQRVAVRILEDAGKDMKKALGVQQKGK